MCPLGGRGSFPAAGLAQHSATPAFGLVSISIFSPPLSTLCASLQKSLFQRDLFYFHRWLWAVFSFQRCGFIFSLQCCQKHSHSHLLLHNLYLFLSLSHNCSNNLNNTKCFQIQTLNPWSEAFAEVILVDEIKETDALIANECTSIIYSQAHIFKGWLVIFRLQSTPGICQFILSLISSLGVLLNFNMYFYINVIFATTWLVTFVYARICSVLEYANLALVHVFEVLNSPWLVIPMYVFNSNC